VRVCHVTNFWPNRHGHAHYTDALIAGMRQSRPEQHVIAGEGATATVATDAYRAVPCWHRQEDYVAGIVRTVCGLRADVALLQYSDDLLGEDDRLPRLLTALDAAGVKTVVNCHSVYPPDRRTRYAPGRDAQHFYRAVGAAAAAINVHSRRMRDDLVGQGVAPEKVSVIPHGSLVRAPLDRVACRRALSVPADAKVVLFFGFVWLGKGLDFLLDVFSHVLARVPDAWLYVAGYTRRRMIVTRLYMGYLRARMRWLDIARRTSAWGDYVPDDRVPMIYSAADVVALPYRQDYSSVSGVVHQAAGFDRIFACSRIAKFEEVGEQVDPDLLVAQDDVRAWTRLLTRLLTDERYAAAMREKVRRFAAATSWEMVGREFLALFERLLDGRTAALAEG
jgi:glycosyltransferase involved in cell wall biosynthesis